jgi:cyclase
MDLPIGEVMLNSIDKDGTGQGLDMALLTLLPNDISKPLILTGGVGNASHLAVGLSDAKVDAVNTANLFNFVGDGLRKARKQLISGGHGSPHWDSQLAAELQNCFAI